MGESLIVHLSGDAYAELQRLAVHRHVNMFALASDLLAGAVRFETLADSALGVVPPD